MEPWENLALRAQKGDRTASSELFRRLRPVLLKLARTVQAAGHDAEDLAQIALVRILERLPRYTYPRPFGAWAKVVGRRIMLDCARHAHGLAGQEEIGWDVVADRPPPGGNVCDIVVEGPAPEPDQMELPSWWVAQVMQGLSDQEKADVAERFGFAGREHTGRQVARAGQRRDAQVRKQLRRSVEWMRLVFETRYGIPA